MKPEIVFESESHTYWIEGRRVPSQSEVSSTLLKSFVPKTEAFENARIEGDNFHLWIQYYLTNGIPPKSKNMKGSALTKFNAFLDFFKDSIYEKSWKAGNCDIECIETLTYGDYLICGTIDFRDNENKICLDWKTGIQDKLKHQVQSVIYEEMTGFKTCMVYFKDAKKSTNSYLSYDTKSCEALKLKNSLLSTAIMLRYQIDNRIIK